MFQQLAGNRTRRGAERSFARGQSRKSLQLGAVLAVTALLGLSTFLIAQAGSVFVFSGPESLGSPRFCLGGFFLAVLRRRGRLQRIEKTRRDRGYLVDGSQK